MPTSWKTLRVFISSTFKDMQAERDHLVRFVFPRLREQLLPRRIHLVDVDLRWGVTSDQDALGVCRQVIDECRPRFLCMLGGRYGWVPPGREHSITADEVRYGVLDRLGRHGFAFFYFRDPQATAQIVEETAGECREPPGSGAECKLDALKQAVSDAGLEPFVYPAKWDAQQRRFTKLDKFGDRVFADLLGSIQAEFADRFAEGAAVQADEFAEEADAMEAFVEERVERYVVGSRQPLLDALTNFAAAANGTPSIFVLTGEPGSGKSALLAKFTRDLSAIRHSPFVISHFIGASAGSTDLRRTLRRLCHELARAAGNTEPLPLDIKELITHFQKLLAEAAQGDGPLSPLSGSGQTAQGTVRTTRQRVILVFDALNQFDATDGAHWLNWLPRELPPGVRIVASVIAPTEGQPEHQTLAILRNRPDSRVVKLEPLTEADTLAIIEGYLRRYSKRLSAEQVAALKEKPAGRLPLYVLTVLEELRTLGTYDEITDRIRELPGDARALFAWILTERLANDPIFGRSDGEPRGRKLMEKFAACLGVSRHGLSPAELTALLDPNDPLGNVAALLRLLRPYLMRRGELLDFYHGQFREAAEAIYLGTPEKQCAAHQSVATCLQVFSDPRRDGQCRDATPHALSELPHHQTRAEAWPGLIATLENLFFLEAKVTHGMAFDLAEDFTAAVNALPPEHIERRRLRLLAEALRRDIHFIARHAKDYPQALFQCLRNSCWWYDCPDAAPYYVVPEGGWKEMPPWENPDPDLKLSTLLERWRTERETANPDFHWVRALNPPFPHLGAGQIVVLRGHEEGVTSVAFSPDRSRVLSGSHDWTMRLWDAQRGQELVVLRKHQGAVTSVAFSPDGCRVLSGSEDKTLRLWEVPGGRELAVLRGHENTVWSVAFSPDGQRMLSGSEDKTVRVWDAQDGRELVILRGHQDAIHSVAFSTDGCRILSGSRDKTVRIWDALNGLELAVLRGHNDIVWSVAFSSDGRRVLSGSNDWTARMWDAVSGRELAVLNPYSGGAAGVAFSPDGCHILSGWGDKTVRVWDAQTGREVAVLRGHEDVVWSVAFSADGRRILSGSSDKTVRIWDAKSGLEPAVLYEHESDVTSLTFSPDSRRLVSGSKDRTMRLWDESGRELIIVRGHQGKVSSVAFSRDGRQILSGSWDKTVRLWDAQSGRELAVMRGHTRQVNSVAFSPDGRRMLSGSNDFTVRLWAQNGRELAVLGGNQDVMSVAFSPDGQRIVGGSDELRVWAKDGKVLAVFGSDGYVHGYVKGVAFSSDGRRVVSGWQDERVRLWNAESRDFVEIAKGSGDIAAIAAGATIFPCRAMARDGETHLEFATSGQIVAWFPDALDPITTHRGGRMWAGVFGNHFRILRLEGGFTFISEASDERRPSKEPWWKFW